MNSHTNDTAMATLLRSRLLDWKPQPSTAHGHRTAASALRAEADLLIGSS